MNQRGHGKKKNRNSVVSKTEQTSFREIRDDTNLSFDAMKTRILVMVSVSRHCVCRNELSPEKRRRKKVGISIYVRYIYREREVCALSNKPAADYYP